MSISRRELLGHAATAAAAAVIPAQQMLAEKRPDDDANCKVIDLRTGDRVKWAEQLPGRTYLFVGINPDGEIWEVALWRTLREGDIFGKPYPNGYTPVTLEAYLSFFNTTESNEGNQPVDFVKRGTAALSASQYIQHAPDVFIELMGVVSASKGHIATTDWTKADGTPVTKGDLADFMSAVRRPL